MHTCRSRRCPHVEPIFRSYEHVTSVRNNSLDPSSFVFFLFIFPPSLSLSFFLSLSLSFFLPPFSRSRSLRRSGEPVPLLGPPMLPRTVDSSASSTVYTSNTAFRTLTDLVVAIASPNIRGHVLSSNDPNRNYSGPPTKRAPRRRCLRGSQRCIL